MNEAHSNVTKRSLQDMEDMFDFQQVLRMTEAYKGMNHLIFMNNLFSSPGLFSTLLNKKIFASGRETITF